MPLGPVSQPGASARLPTAPTSISASAVSGGQAAVSFVASTNPGKGSGNYVVTSSPSSFTASGASSPITITGLTTGIAYTFTVVKQSGSGISSVSSSASNSIGAFTTPIFGTQTGTSTAVEPSTSTTSVSSVSTTTATLASSIGANGTFWNYGRVTGSGGASATTSTSLTGLTEKTAHSWRVNVFNTSSNQSLVTRVTPNGSSCTVAVVFGDTIGYGSSASVLSGLASIGSGTTEVSTTWSLGSSTKGNYGSTDLEKTIYYKITVTYAGGAIEERTGTIFRTINLYNGNATSSFTTYGTYSYEGSSGITISKPSVGVNISSITYNLWGGGAGGATNRPGGGGGGGGYRTATGRTSSGTISIVIGAGGAGDGYGNDSLYQDSGGAFYSGRGTPGAFNQGGACEKFDGTYHFGALGNSSDFHSAAGGGGGSSGAGGGGAYGVTNGGPGNLGRGLGGPGVFWDVASGSGTGSGSDGSSGSGGGGRGGFFPLGESNAGQPGGSGYFTITYVGPAKN